MTEFVRRWGTGHYLSVKPTLDGLNGSQLQAFMKERSGQHLFDGYTCPVGRRKHLFQTMPIPLQDVVRLPQQMELFRQRKFFLG